MQDKPKEARVRPPYKDVINAKPIPEDHRMEWALG